MTSKDDSGVWFSGPKCPGLDSVYDYYSAFRSNFEAIGIDSSMRLLFPSERDIFVPSSFADNTRDVRILFVQSQNIFSKDHANVVTSRHKNSYKRFTSMR